MVNPTSSDSMNITWSPPKSSLNKGDGATCISHYKISLTAYTNDTDEYLVEDATNETFYNITSLSPGKYIIRVSSLFSGGNDVHGEFATETLDVFGDGKYTVRTVV